jgi:hypothetical protein
MLISAEAGFEVFVTMDKQIEHQQNLAALALPVVILDGTSNAISALLPFTPFLRDLFTSSLERALYIVEASGTVVMLRAPRSS